MTTLPHKKLVIFASQDMTLKIWNLNSNNALFNLGEHQDMVIALAVTTDERWLISASLDHTLKVWDLQNGNNIATFTADSPWAACAVSPTESKIFAVDRSGIVHFIELAGI